MESIIPPLLSLSLSLSLSVALSLTDDDGAVPPRADS